MTNKTMPEISIIMSMYNFENYIGELLDCILAQTFDDYEVIVVDDCSTDNSAAVVESYVPKFAGKLQFIRQKVNSGNPGKNFNLALSLSRGKYVYILDADDTITNTALEELYKVAEEFQADVVQCQQFRAIPDKMWGKIDKLSVAPMTYPTVNLVTAPTLLSENFAERVQMLQQRRFLWPYWTQLTRRDCIMRNELRFTSNFAVDMIYTSCLVCCAKRYVLIPNAVNFYRVVHGSLSHNPEDIPKSVHKYLEALTTGFKCVDKFLSGQEFFQQRPDAKYAALDIIVREFANYLLKIYAQVPAFQLDALIRAELEKVSNLSALSAFLFSRMNIFNVNLLQQQQLIQNQQQQIQQLQAQLQQAQPSSFQLQTEDIFKQN